MNNGWLNAHRRWLAAVLAVIIIGGMGAFAVVLRKVTRPPAPVLSSVVLPQKAAASEPVLETLRSEAIARWFVLGLKLKQEPEYADQGVHEYPMEQLWQRPPLAQEWQIHPFYMRRDGQVFAPAQPWQGTAESR